MPTIVNAFGPRDAKIVFCGEAPGREEELEGRPFVGSSGRLLNQTLDKVGINRHECYLTNVVRVRPPANDFNTFYVDGVKRRQPSSFLEQSIKELHEDLKTLSPNVICPLGAEAFRALAGLRPGGIEKWRGSILDTPFGKLVGTYHPAYILRMYEDIPIFELDIRRVKEESTCKDYKRLTFNIIVEPTFEQAISYLKRRPNRVAFDIETTWGAVVRSIAFSSDGYEAISIPFTVNPQQHRRGNSSVTLIDSPVSHVAELNSYWPEEQEYAILQEMDRLFRDTSVVKIAQNAPFDTTVLAQEFGFVFASMSLDTMLAHHCCYCELPKGLDFLASIYTRIPYYSSYDPSVDRETWVYNCYDALATVQVAETVERDMVDFGVDELYHNHINPSMLTFTRAQNRGVKIDEVERSKQRDEMAAEIVKLKLEIQTVVGKPDFNPSSTKQMQEYLYGELKLDEVRHHKTKALTTDKNAMEKLSIKYPQRMEFFDAVEEFRGLSTIYNGFYCLKLPKGRIFTSFNNAGTTTFRLSSAESFLHPDDGTNLQNIPVQAKKRLRLVDGEYKTFTRKPPTTRRCFVADDGYVIIKADLSQAEFRLVVWFAKIERLIKVYVDNPDFDVHRWVASLIYKKPEALIVKDERDVAKNGVYGGNYKMGDITAARTYKLPFALAKWVLAEYRKQIPEIPLWWQTVQSELASKRFLINPLGIRRHFFGRVDDDMLREALAFLPSSTVGGIINRAASLSDELFDPTECQLLLQVHDELVLQCRAEKRYVEHYVPIIKTLLEYPLTFPGISQPLVIPADIGLGHNWLDAKTKLKDYNA